MNHQLQTRSPQFTGVLSLSALLCSCLSALTGCGAQGLDEQSFEAEPVGEHADTLIARTKKLSMPAGNQLDVNIKLCWNSDAWPVQDRDKFKEGAQLYTAALKETWFGTDAKLVLDITDACSEGYKKIAVTSFDADPNASAPEANFKFTNLFSPSCNASGANWKKCVKMFAVRSMGYYLGFGDEESASGDLAAVPCPDGHHELVDAIGDTTAASAVGTPIMSVCRKYPMGDHLLSTGDVNGLKAMYGGGGNVSAGKLYALRFTNKENISNWRGRYLSSSGWSSDDKIRGNLNADPVAANMFSFNYVSGNGTLGNGEVIRILRSDGKALCLPGPCSVNGCQAPAWTTAVDGVACGWTAAVLAGGESVQDTDPVRLTAKFPAVGNPALTNVQKMQVRFVGPLPKPHSGS